MGSHVDDSQHSDYQFVCVSFRFKARHNIVYEIGVFLNLIAFVSVKYPRMSNFRQNIYQVFELEARF